VIPRVLGSDASSRSTDRSSRRSSAARMCRRACDAERGEVPPSGHCLPRQRERRRFPHIAQHNPVARAHDQEMNCRPVVGAGPQLPGLSAAFVDPHPRFAGSAGRVPHRERRAELWQGLPRAGHPAREQSRAARHCQARCKLGWHAALMNLAPLEMRGPPRKLTRQPGANRQRRIGESLT
jgi:hypothetical protein